jgi:hypothetical protein
MYVLNLLLIYVLAAADFIVKAFRSYKTATVKFRDLLWFKKKLKRAGYFGKKILTVKDWWAKFSAITAF